MYQFLSILVSYTFRALKYEYYDIEVDRLTADNRTWFSGGSGVLSAGSIPPAAAMDASRICAVVALLTGILASFLSGWMIPIIIFSLPGSWFYSSPPLSLMSSGWGELTTSIISALLVPLADYCMQGGFPSGEKWLVSLPLVLTHTTNKLRTSGRSYRTMTEQSSPPQNQWMAGQQDTESREAQVS